MSDDDHHPDKDDETPDTADESGEYDNVPTIICSRCDSEWDLTYELDVLRLGNQSGEQFALDHMRHTGHFPDSVSPWTVDCRQCPSSEQFLSERPATRWATTHARHTRHTVAVNHPEQEETLIDPAEF